MVEQLDLLHLDRVLTPKERRQLAVQAKSKRRGYAAPPGTGPKGEICGTCQHIARGRRYAKCALMRQRWTHGYATDILVRAEACRKWEPNEG